MRARNCFRRQNISTLGELADCSADEVLEWQNAGRKTLDEIRSLLGKVGLALKGELPIGRIDTGLLNEKLEEATRGPIPDPLTLHIDDASEDLQRILVTLVTELVVSVRAQGVLQKAGPQYVGDLVQLRIDDIKAIWASGRKTTKELQTVVQNFGLQFGMNIPDWSNEKAADIRRRLRKEIMGAARDRDREVLAAIGPDPHSLEEELTRIAGALERGRNADLLVRLWGWSGRPPRTLESVGSELHLTRERVRQIEARALRKLRRHQFDVPFLRSAIALLRKQVPGFDDVLAAKISEHKISLGNFSPESIQCAAELLEINWPFEFATVGNLRVLSELGKSRQITESLSILRRKTSEQGCVNIEALVAELGGEERDLPAIRTLFERLEEVTGLDDDHEWAFSASSARNRLFNICAKALSVVERLYISELRRAVSRSRRLAMSPPQGVLSKFVERTGLADVKDGIAYPVPAMCMPLNPDSAEARMLRVLTKHGPVIDGEEFAERCIEEGINATTVYIYRIISPVITALGRNVFCRIGTDVPPGTVEAIVARRRSVPRVSDYGWTAAGKLWFGIELMRVMLVSGSIRMPTFVAELVQGDWSVLLPDGTAFGSVCARDSFIWSFRKHFALLGAEPSDLAVFEFDRKGKEVTVRVGGPSLFETIQEPEQFAAEAVQEETAGSDEAE